MSRWKLGRGIQSFTEKRRGTQSFTEGHRGARRRAEGQREAEKALSSSLPHLLFSV
jgi:hypothetical protein